MTTLVIDASIAIKWVVEEEGTPQALILRQKARLVAPELLVAECANILWKKVRRHELSIEEASFAARLLQGADVELLPSRTLLETVTNMAVALGHPAYDCLYLAHAIHADCAFVTADEVLLRKLDQQRRKDLRARAMSLMEAGGA